MDKTPIYIFFDSIKMEYTNHYGEKGEEIMIKELREYLSDCFKTSKITIITTGNLWDVMEWFKKNELSAFVHVFKNQELQIIS